MSFDFKTLQKSRAYSYMGRLGDDLPCSWDPTTWPDCINVLRNARKEFQQNYTLILQMENSYQVALQELNAQPPSAERDDMIARTNQRAQDAAAARQQGVDIANQLEDKISQWNWIPGFDTIFLDGLRGRGLGRLGKLGQVLPPVTPPMAIFYVVSGLVIVTSLAFVVGQLAHSWRATEEVEIAKHNAWGSCMKAFDDAIAANKTPPSCGDAPQSQDWTTLALIGGSLFLVMMLGRK